MFCLQRIDFKSYKEETKKLKSDSKLANNCYATLKAHCAQTVTKQMRTYRNSNINLHF